MAAERIALVKLSSLGDVVHALPVAATLRAARPDAWLAWLKEQLARKRVAEPAQQKV